MVLLCGLTLSNLGVLIVFWLCRIPGERIDVWLVRYNGMGPANYWGFKQLRYTEAEEVGLSHAPASYFLSALVPEGAC